MSNLFQNITASELADVIGGEGTGAKSLPGAIGHYLTNNGTGSFLNKAGVLGTKAWDRVKYSAAITPTIDQYSKQIEGLPGGNDYVADIKRLRPSK